MPNKMTYDTVGMVPDMSEIITNISPEDTPLFSLFPKGSNATNTTHGWLEDELPAPKDNAQIEGFTYTTEAPAPRDDLMNITQIYYRAYGVTKTQEAVKKYGVKSEIARAMDFAMKAIATDVEHAIINNTTRVVGSTATARRMAGLPYYLVTNVLSNATPRDLTFDLIKRMCLMIRVKGGKADKIVCSWPNKGVISAMSGTNQDKTMPAKDKKITERIDVIHTDYGIVSIIPNTWLPSNRIYVLTSEHYAKNYLRPFSKDRLPNVSSNHQYYIEGELTIEVRAERASGIITNLNTPEAA